MNCKNLVDNLSQEEFTELRQAIRNREEGYPNLRRLVSDEMRLVIEGKRADAIIHLRERTMCSTLDARKSIDHWRDHPSEAPNS